MAAPWSGFAVNPQCAGGEEVKGSKRCSKEITENERQGRVLNRNGRFLSKCTTFSAGLVVLVLDC